MFFVGGGGGFTAGGLGALLGVGLAILLVYLLVQALRAGLDALARAWRRRRHPG